MTHLAGNLRRDTRPPQRQSHSSIPAATLPVQPTLDALFLTPDSIVVELGEEAGRFTLPVARYFATKNGGGTVYACDFTDRSVERVDQKVRDAHLQAHARTCRIERVKPYGIPVPNESVDAILAINPKQYRSAPDIYLQECLRILRPGGSMLLAKRSDTSAGGNHLKSSFEMPLDKMFSTLKTFGAEICTTIDISGYHWAVLVVKPLVSLPA